MLRFRCRSHRSNFGDYIIMKTMQEYITELKEVLKTDKLDELIKFVKDNKEYYDKEFLKRFLKSNRETQQLAMDKMIEAIITLPEDLRERAKERIKQWRTKK